MDEAAFMAASLYELRKIINEKGYTEVEIYNTMIKNYSAIIKQLTDLLPKEQEKNAPPQDDGFEGFVNGRDD